MANEVVTLGGVNYISNPFDNIFDSTERVIGIWFNKPLYRKILIYTYSGVTSLNETINPNLGSNVDTIVKFEGYFITNTKQIAMATGSGFGIWFNNVATLRISSAEWDSSKTYTIYVYTYYTKTTN